MIANNHPLFAVQKNREEIRLVDKRTNENVSRINDGGESAPNWFRNPEYEFLYYEPSNLDWNWTWNPKYKLYNATVCDSFSDTSGEKWEFVGGYTDTSKHWPIFMIVNQLQNKKHIIPMMNIFEKLDTYKGEGFLEKNDQVDSELMSSGGCVLLGHTIYNGYPRYAFFEGNETGPNDYIYYYDLKIKKFRRVCIGFLIKIVDKENLYIQVWDGEDSQSGKFKYFDQIVTPSGKVLWESKPYYR